MSIRVLSTITALLIPAVVVAQAPRVGPAHGAVLVVGGGSLGPEVLGKFIELAGGPDAIIVDVPTAGGDSVYPADWQGTRSLKAAGAKHVVVRLTDPTLFQCPFIMMTEVGAAYMDDAEAEALRNYLLKGGFLWADDFWGEWAWEAWMEQFGKALPAALYPVKDVPKDHPLFRALFDIGGGVPQIASIGNWLGTGSTSERGAESAVPHARAVFDASGRILALMTHNTDIGDSWEEEASNPQYFYEFSTKGYAFGVNAIVFGMTH